MQEKTDELWQVEEAIEEARQREFNYNHPHLCSDIAQLKEDNIREILNSSETYNHFEELAEANRQKEEITK